MLIKLNIFFAFCIVFASCSGGSEDPGVSIRGVVYRPTDSTPVANTAFLLVQRTSSANRVKESELRVVSNEKGELSGTFKVISFQASIELRNTGNDQSKLSERVFSLGDTVIDFGNVYLYK